MLFTFLIKDQLFHPPTAHLLLITMILDVLSDQRTEIRAPHYSHRDPPQPSSSSVEYFAYVQLNGVVVIIFIYY